MNSHTTGKQRSQRLKTGMKVKILRGNYKGKEGKVSKLDTKRQKAYVEGIETTRRDGAKAFVSIHHSNLLIKEE